jgi:hypothetical protein
MSDSVFPLKDFVDIQTIIDALNELNASAMQFNVLSVSSNITYAPSATEYAVMLVNTTAARTITLSSSIPNNTRIVIKDASGNAHTNNITITSSATIDGVVQSLKVDVNGGSLTVIKTSSGLITLGYRFQNSEWMDNVTFFEQQLQRSVTVPALFSAFSVGPITVPVGKSINVAQDARYVVF